jgi:Icc-related predicted phosphoesterase
VSKAFNVGNYKIIILDSNFTRDDKDVVPGNGYTRGHISEKQIKFLEKELKNTDKRTIVFMHHPPLWSIDGKSNFAFPDNAKKLQEIFSENKTFAVFAGHIEDLFLQEIGGVKYFVSPGIVKNEKYQGTFSEITIKKDKLIIEMSYLKSDGSYRTIRTKED